MHEFEFYLSEKVNLDKRISSMILERFFKHFNLKIR
jgi:hypothetical protein